MIRQFFSSPAGRLSIRRMLFALSVVTSCGVAVASIVLGRDVGTGAVSVLASTVAATAAAAGLGRFAESDK
jgi:hypothetical protein